MSVRFGLDSTSAISVVAHHAIGSSVAIRYLGHDLSKVVTREEYEHNKASGIDTYLVFEDGGRPDLSDFGGGRANAEFAIQQAVSRLGPLSRPVRISFAWDNDPNANPAAADPYFDGVGSVMGKWRSGPYGGKAAVTHLADRGFRNLYQTYAWSNGEWDPRARVRQYSNDHVVGGVGCDFDRIIPGPGGDFGQVDFRSGPNHHYGRFPNQSWNSPWGKLRERDVVRHADGLLHVKHPDRFINYRHKVEAQLNWLAARVYHEVHHGQVRGWGPFWRHWRWPELHNRAVHLSRI